jgi:integrase
VANIVKVNRASKKATWQVRYRDQNHKQVQRTFKTKPLAVQFAATVEGDRARGQLRDINAGRVPFAEYAEQWVADHPGKVKTIEGYRTLLNCHVLPTLGSKQLGSIVQSDIKRLLNGLKTPTGKGLSPARKKQVRQLLNGIFKSAVADQKRTVNPVEGVSVPQPRKIKGQHIYTPAEVRAISEQLTERYQAFPFVAFHIGARLGELQALRRRDYNALHQTITVDEAVSETAKTNGAPSNLTYQSTKTAGGDRTIRIPPELCVVLEEHLAEFVDVSPDALVFTTESGTPLRGSNFREDVWQPALKRAGLPHLIVKDFRHSYISHQVAAGISPVVIAENVGHSDGGALIFKVYARGTDAEHARAVGVSSRLFAGE